MEKIQNNFQMNNIPYNKSGLDEKLLMAYIGNNYSKIIQKKFSLPALFLSWIYILYRKIYIPTIIGMVVIIILGFLPSIIYSIIVFTFVILLGANFNNWYIIYAQKQIQKIKTNNPNVNENQLIDICKQKGGTNIWLAIVIYIIFAIVSSLVNPNVTKINHLVNDSDIDENNSCYVTAKNGADFLQKIDDLSSDCKDYEVTYHKLKYSASKKSYEYYDAYINKLYYSNTELKYITDDSVVNSELKNTYLLDDQNGEDSFLFIFHEVPVPQYCRFYAILFDEKGEIKFLDSAIGGILYDENTKELSYSVGNSSLEPLDLPNRPDEEVCDYIKEYDKDTLYSGTYTYKYENKKMNLIKSEEVTIADLMKEHNCKIQ